MTLEIFIGTIACAIIAVVATVGCLVLLYKAGADHHAADWSNFGGSLFCGAVAVAAIFCVFALTRNIVWAFII